MHKYVLNIVISQSDTGRKTVIPLPETTFIAVTTYHNVELIKLKIAENPTIFYEPFEEIEPTSKSSQPLSPPTTILTTECSSNEGYLNPRHDSVGLLLL